jgi:hypothetical protein
MTHISTEKRGAHLVVPEGGEDEVHLDEDAPEGQQPAHDRNHGGREVPLLLGDGPRDGLHPARVIWNPAPVAAHHGAQERKGERDERPDEEDNHLEGSESGKSLR